MCRPDHPRASSLRYRPEPSSLQSHAAGAAAPDNACAEATPPHAHLNPSFHRQKKREGSTRPNAHILCTSHATQHLTCACLSANPGGPSRACRAPPARGPRHLPSVPGLPWGGLPRVPLACVGPPCHTPPHMPTQITSSLRQRPGLPRPGWGPWPWGRTCIGARQPCQPASRRFDAAYSPNVSKRRSTACRHLTP
jgi:hypothetical protein